MKKVFLLFVKVFGHWIWLVISLAVVFNEIIGRELGVSIIYFLADPLLGGFTTANYIGFALALIMFTAAGIYDGVKEIQHDFFAAVTLMTTGLLLLGIFTRCYLVLPFMLVFSFMDLLAKTPILGETKKSQLTKKSWGWDEEEQREEK